MGADQIRPSFHDLETVKHLICKPLSATFTLRSVSSNRFNGENLTALCAQGQTPMLDSPAGQCLKAL